MPEIIDYKVIIAKGVDIASEVQYAIRNGWQPYGPLSFGVNYYNQAMVKYAKAYTMLIATISV